MHKSKDIYPYFGKIAVFGDIMIDEYQSGKVTKLSPEGPYPVLVPDTLKIVPGGAANVARNIASLGGEVKLIGLVGSDAKETLDILTKAKVDCNDVFIKGKKTTTKRRLKSGNHTFLRIDKDQIWLDSDLPMSEMVESVLNYQPDVLVISDYAKGTVGHEVCQRLIAQFSGPTIVDPKGTDWSKFEGAWSITPNILETEKYIGSVAKNNENIDGLYKYGLKISETTKIKNVVITLGEAGYYLGVHDEQFEYTKTFKALPVDNPDVCGAGDTFLAAYALTCIKYSLITSLELANVAASIAVSKIGTYSVNESEWWDKIKYEKIKLLTRPQNDCD